MHKVLARKSCVRYDRPMMAASNISSHLLSAFDVVRPVFGHHLQGQDFVQSLGLERPSTFLFQMASNLMIPFILPRDFLIVRRGFSIQRGQIILSSVNGQFCCRYLKSFPRPIILEAFNGPKIQLGSSDHWQIFGRVTGILRLELEHPLCWP